MITIEDLSVNFGRTEAVRHVSLEIPDGEILGVVGESGSGKSVTALTLMGLVSEEATVTGGRILYDDVVLQEAGKPRDKALYRRYQGARMSMVFQEPMTSLNPTQRVGRQVEEMLRLHSLPAAGVAHGTAQGGGDFQAPIEGRLRLCCSRQERQAMKQLVLETFAAVGLRDPERVYGCYPHQLSGGMRQRVMIAMALANKPDLLIADEPTTALDVTIQDQILRQLRELEKEYGTSIIFITHDLGVVAELCDRVAVMYGGLIMEEAPIDDIFEKTGHPYTMGLLASVPDMDQDKEIRLQSIPGSPPDMTNPPKGCPFAPRCPYARQLCASELPDFVQVGEGHRSRCFLRYSDAPADANNPFRK